MEKKRTAFDIARKHMDVAQQKYVPLKSEPSSLILRLLLAVGLLIAYYHLALLLTQ
jgi:hypothetical protein